MTRFAQGCVVFVLICLIAPIGAGNIMAICCGIAGIGLYAWLGRGGS